MKKIYNAPQIKIISDESILMSTASLNHEGNAVGKTKTADSRFMSDTLWDDDDDDF